MSDGREIKKSGYLYGTRMYRVRNWYVAGVLTAAVITTVVISKFLYKPDKIAAQLDRFQQTQLDWDKKQAERNLEVLERRQRQHERLEPLISVTSQRDQ